MDDDNDDKMDILSFIEDKKREIERFQRFWADGVKDDPDCFSSTMTLEEWHEQFNCWEYSFYNEE